MIIKSISSCSGPSDRGFCSSSNLSIAGDHQIRNANPTIIFRDTNERTAYIHVNSNVFYVLSAVADSGYGSWAQVANSRWPLEINLSTNNAVFGADVNAISFTGAGTGLTGTAASLTAGAVTNGIYTTSVIYIGTTAITMSRSSAAQTLTGVSIDGSANSLAADTSTRFKVITFTGEGGDSGNGNAATNYGIYQQGGSWTNPYPDLCIGFHTGIKIGAQTGYGGIRFYNTETWGTEIFSVGNGDNNVRVVNTIYAAAFSGPLTGNVTGNVTGSSGSCTGNAANITAYTINQSVGTGNSPSFTGLSVINNITGNVTGSATSISGFNNPTTAATVNTIVYRDSGGDIYARYLFGSYVNSSDDTGSTGLTYIMAKFGNDYHRSATADKVAAFISNQTMNINGSSTSCSGTATTATTANALNTSNSYTIAGLTNNGTETLFPAYSGGYSYFLRMGYDTSGYYDYTIKRNGTTGLLEFNGTQSAPYAGYVFSGGNVGIGTTSPGYKLDVNGNIHATAFPASSDIRFKKNITPLENSLEKVKKLQGVRYEWNEFINSKRDGYKLNVPIIGLIAQDVEKIVPEIIELWKLSDDCQDARSIDYPRLIPVLIEAIKEQQIIIENQNQKIENLISRVSALEAK